MHVAACLLGGDERSLARWVPKTSPPDLFIVHHTYVSTITIGYVWQRRLSGGLGYCRASCRCPVTGEEGRRLVVERYRVRSSSGELLLWLVERNAAAETGERLCIIAIAR